MNFDYGNLQKVYFKRNFRAIERDFSLEITNYRNYILVRKKIQL